MNKRVLIFIPVFNCEKQIPRVIAKIDKAVQNHVEEVLIIDNRSHDNTLAEAISASTMLGTKVTILRNVQNYNLARK